MLERTKTFHRRKIVIVFFLCVLMLVGLMGRLVYLMVFRSDYYQEKADDLHERERSIKAARGKIIDRTGTVLATNRTVCTVSVIHSQVKEPEKVIEMLCKELGLSEEMVRKRVEKVSSIERIKANVDKEVGDKIRSYDLAGVKVDEDFKRYYPYDTTASKVLGFTGSDNQGIIGLEVYYEEYLKGIDGTILTQTDARGIELDGEAEERVEAIAGNNLHLTLDYNIQMYCEQAAKKVLEEKEAEYVSIILMNPQDGSIYANVNVPEFDLNHPFELPENVEESVLSEKERNDALNRMWRNQSINDTYEPGSTFKIITSTIALETGVVSVDDTFSCPGFAIVEDRKIRCHKVKGHGTQNFAQGLQNSCNPVFINVGLRVGADYFYEGMKSLGLLSKTGIDLSGEAGTIMHKKETIGLVELATMSFGQSFQITPMQLAATVSSIINGGVRVTPHFAKEIRDEDGRLIKTFDYGTGERIISEETSAAMRTLLEGVVSEGGGSKGQVEGYRIGGKTATSQTLPRSAKQYISSFVAFAPANDPKVLGLVIIAKPTGVYYGGTIAAPVLQHIFENILPYLEIETVESST